MTVVLSILVWCVAGPTRAVEFAGGTGEPNDPYQIATAEQLMGIGSDPNLLDKHYVLAADIDLDPNLPGGRVFDGPVLAGGQSESGSIDPNFTGVLNGQGYKIRNLVIRARADGTAALGLFGGIGEGACVRNLAVENVSIVGHAESLAAGALVGVNRGLVQTCYATGSIIGGDRVGGLCGDNRSKIRSCYATALVSGQSFVGGLVGYDESIRSRATRGAVAGYIVNCFAAGAVSGYEKTGGLTGAGGTALGSFWDIETSGQKGSAGGLGLPTFQMMEAVVFAAYGWDQDPNWVMDDGRDYPRLAWEGTPGQSIRSQISDRLGGSGTPQDPYHIATSEHFALLGILPGLSDKHFVLDADLDLTGIPVRPIGNFNGFFHGNGRVLRHLTLEVDEPVTPASEAHGVFADIGQGGRVSRLGLEDVEVAVTEDSHTIGVLAAVNEGVVTGCYATGVVHAGQHESTIGLIGVNAGVVARSYVRLEVRGSNAIGCLVGRNSRWFESYLRGFPGRTTYWGLILECYAVHNTPETDARGCLAVTSDESTLCLNSYCLTPWEAEERDSFLGWDFAGSSADGAVDRWCMPDHDYPVLSRQVTVEGFRSVPDVSDLPLDWARAELELAGFVVGEMLHDYHSAIPADRAILTSPIGLAPLGSTIDIIVSQGVYRPPYVDPGSVYNVIPLLVRLDTPGQIECLAGGFSGDAVYVLDRDIDMAGWDVLPIPSTQVRATYQDTPSLFDGVLLGDGHKISNLTSRRGKPLFDGISLDGVVEELRLENVLMTDSDVSAGGLAVENYGIVLQCAVTGVLIGSENTSNLGGLVGVNHGLIEECFVDAAVHGSQSEQADPGTEPKTAGGMVGYNKATITDSYVRGRVYGSGCVGGLAGRNSGSSVTRSYAAAEVAGSQQEGVGGLIGYANSVSSRSGPAVQPHFANCYLLCPTCGGGPDNGRGIPLTAEAMRQQTSFAGWDFENTWTICEGRDYPRLRWEPVECEGGS